MIELSKVDSAMRAILKKIEEIEAASEKMKIACEIASQNAKDGSITLTEWKITDIANGVSQIRTIAGEIEDALPEEY